MNLHRLNLFMAWLLIPLTFVLGWVAFIGRMLLEVLGASTPEGSVPGIVVGLLLAFAAVFTIQHVRGALWPQGDPAGTGYSLGQRLVLVANALALFILLFRLAGPLVTHHDAWLVLDRFTDAFGYWVMGMWAIGFSFLYQSALTAKAKA